MRYSANQVSVGIDVGGTFTDIISYDHQTGALSVLKSPTSKDPASSIARDLTTLVGRPQRVSIVSHATTMATNALLTRSNLARTALITNEGFRDVVEIGRQRRAELYNLRTKRPPPLVERRNRFTVRCRIDGHGSEIEPLEAPSAKSVASEVVDGGFGAVAVSFLNSYLNPSHELQMGTALLQAGFRGHVSLSSEIDREYREYERTSTAVVNAVLSPLMTGYLSGLEVKLRKKRVDSPIYVMNSDGGASTLTFASKRPVLAIESGPAAGVVASARLARQLSLDRVLTFDMGGTTAKAGTVVDGEPELTNEFEAAGRTHSGRSIKGSGYPVRGSFIDLAEVSAGGGTIAWLDEAKELQVGPHSAGADPGPACYARGGTEPTVTDANALLGRLNPKQLLGGGMPVRKDLAASAIRRLSKKLGVDESAAAMGVLRIVNDAMAKAISIVSTERGKDARDFTMVAFGGAGPMHACDLAEEMNISNVVVPIHAGLFSAYGLLAGDLTMTFTSPVGDSAGGLARTFSDLKEAVSGAMKLEGFSSFRTERHVEARYTGQSHEILLPYRSQSSLRKEFDSRHKALYGYTSPDPLEVVNAKVKAVVTRPGPIRLGSRQAEGMEGPGRRPAWVGGKTHDVDVFRREAMRTGDVGRGPCIIEEYDSTLIVNPGWRWKAEDYGTRLTR